MTSAGIIISAVGEFKALGFELFGAPQPCSQHLAMTQDLREFARFAQAMRGVLSAKIFTKPDQRRHVTHTSKDQGRSPDPC